MTIKWVVSDPLVMNGEPFCHATRLTVRNVLDMRLGGMTPGAMIAENPELRLVGIAEAFRYASEHPQRYADLLGTGGELQGPGFTEDEAALLPEDLRDLRGVVVSEPEQAAAAG